MRCDKCEERIVNFTATECEIYDISHRTGWSSSSLFKCEEVRCENHKDNTDLSALALGIYRAPVEYPKDK